MADIPADHPAVTRPKQALANNSLLLAPGNKVKSAVKGGSSAKKRKSSDLNIKVHSKSKISAQGWLTKIRNNQNIPDYYKNQIKRKSDAIYVTNPRKFRIPNNVIQKPWRDDWLSAFVTPEWEIATGCLHIIVKKSTSSGLSITVTHNPDLSKNESISGFTKSTMTAKYTSTKDVSVERGNTLPNGVFLASGRKLIVIANRIALKLGGGKFKIFNFNDDELVEVWFHEIACHAGRNSQRISDIHKKSGIGPVDSCARDIEQMFPKTSTVPKVLSAISDYLKP